MDERALGEGAFIVYVVGHLSFADIWWFGTLEDQRQMGFQGNRTSFLLIVRLDELYDVSSIGAGLRADIYSLSRWKREGRTGGLL